MTMFSELCGQMEPELFEHICDQYPDVTEEQFVRHYAALVRKRDDGGFEWLYWDTMADALRYFDADFSVNSHLLRSVDKWAAGRNISRKEAVQALLSKALWGCK